LIKQYKYNYLKSYLPTLLSGGVVAGIFLFFQWDNFPGSAALYLGILFFPYLIQKDSPSTNRLLIPVFSGLLLLLFFNSSSLYYVTTAFVLLWLIEISVGKQNPLPFLLILVIAPIFRYLVHIWSFPLRIKMSALVAGSLRRVGMDVTAIGNTIFVNQAVYEIEPACIGIKMTGTALVCCLLILGFFVKERQLKLTWTKALLSLFAGFLLTLFANYIRLLGLVIFDIPPANPVHHLMGIISLVVYVLVPFFFWWSWRQPPITIISEKPLSNQSKEAIPPIWSSYRLILLGTILLGLLFTGRQFGQEKTQPAISKHPWMALTGFSKTQKSYGVLELRRADQLIYIKPPAGPFQGAHDPRICWQGSGFVFKKIKKEIIESLEVYTAEISRDDLILQTAWWYDNGDHQTTEEWDWRWRSLFHGEKYHLINISVNNQEAGTLPDLINEVREATSR